MENLKYKLEDEIRELIYDDNKNSTHFEYYHHKGSTEYFRVRLITLNKKTDVPFLLTEVKASTEEESLYQILDYLKKDLDLHEFTIKWYKKSESAERPYKSKFKAPTMIRAIEKFYYQEKNEESLIIYSISDDNIKSKDYDGQ